MSTTTSSGTTTTTSSSSLSASSVAAAPFNGLRVFLHIREHYDSNGRDRTKHYAKKAIRTLGASLILSESTADLIVFHCGNETLLANATANGKVVVGPEYLQACVARGMRLPVETFLVHPSSRTSAGCTEKKWENGNRNRRLMASAPCLYEGGKLSTTAMALSEVPYLDDDDDDDNGEEEKEYEGGNVGCSAKMNQESFDKKRGTGAPLFPEDGSLNTTKMSSSRRKSTTTYLPPSDTTPTMVEVDCMASRRGAKRLRETLASSSDKNKANEQQDAVTVTATAAQTRGAEEATESAITFTDTSLITPLFPPHPGAVTTGKGTITRRRSRRGMCVSTLSVPLRIAVSGENDDVIHFLSDVVEQLGAICVPHVFGRGRKPTHLVLEGRGELTPVVLLAMALGIPVLTPQWLYDAISLGAFPKILDAHLHPIYNNTNKNNTNNNSNNGNRKKSSDQNEGLPVDDETQERRESGCDTVGQSMKKKKKKNDLRGELVDLLGDDVGPHYKSLFLGMSFAFVGHSPLAHTDQFMELVRILGGTVSRSALGVNLSVIVDLAYSTVTQHDDEEEEEHVRVGRTASGKERASRSSMMRRTVPCDNAGVSSHPSQPLLQRIMGQRLRSGVTAVPVVYVEWIIQCILLGDVTEMAPFEVPLTVSESVKTVMEINRHEDPISSTCSGNSEGNRERLYLSTPPEQTTWRDGAHRRVGSEDSGRTVTSRLPLLVADPLAKTVEGPSSAKKRAEQQLNTQQLLLLDDSDFE